MDRNDKSLNDRGDIVRNDDGLTTRDEIGQAVGGVSGVVAGAAIGSAVGPIGTVIGGLAGAVGGWWAGRAVAESARKFDDHADSTYRQAYESRSDRLADRSYDDVRPAYQLGHLASENPDYSGRNFESIEEDLQRGWSNDLRARHGDWSTVRPFAEEAYGSRASQTTRDLGNRAINAADSLKDRVDGNPASKPGPDPTDRRF